MESFDLLSTWSTAHPDGAAVRYDMQHGTSQFRNLLIAAGGSNAAGTTQATTYEFDTISWNTANVIPSARIKGSTGEAFGKFMLAQGTTGAVGSSDAKHHDYDGTTWTDRGTVWTTMGARSASAGFTYASTGNFHVCAGVNTASAAQTTHYSWDDTSISVQTVTPFSGGDNGPSGTQSGNGVVYDSNVLDYYVWTGSWGSAIASPHQLGGSTSHTGGAEITGGNFFQNGDNVAGGTAGPLSTTFDGITIAVSTSSGLSRMTGAYAAI